MEYTQNLKLKKPQRGANADAVDINDLNYNADKIDAAITGQMKVTIPISGWTTNTDDDSTNYYSIDINVTGMTSAYVGTNACDYVRPATYNVAELETIQEMFNLITDIQSNDGYITVYASEIPTTAFQIYLYGVG